MNTVLKVDNNLRPGKELNKCISNPQQKKSTGQKEL